MPNKNYVNGRDKEYKICKQLKVNGFDITQRSAGSHSPIDIFAINRLTRVIKFVQCKPDNFSELNKRRIMEELGYLKDMWRVEFELI